MKPSGMNVAIPLHNTLISNGARRRTRTCTPLGSRILSPLRLPFRQAGMGGRYSRRSSGRNPLRLSMLAATAPTLRGRPTQGTWAAGKGGRDVYGARGRTDAAGRRDRRRPHRTASRRPTIFKVTLVSTTGVTLCCGPDGAMWRCQSHPALAAARRGASEHLSQAGGSSPASKHGRVRYAGDQCA
jgi:hypothetical protein